jgi:hypothetical protein
MGEGVDVRVACGMVGIFAAVIQRFEAQAGAVHMRVLWALVGPHLCKSMGGLHIVSQGVFAVANACPCAMTVAGERRPLVERLTALFNCFSQVRDDGTEFNWLKKEIAA